MPRRRIEVQDGPMGRPQPPFRMPPEGPGLHELAVEEVRGRQIEEQLAPIAALHPVFEEVVEGKADEVVAADEVPARRGDLAIVAEVSEPVLPRALDEVADAVGPRGVVHEMVHLGRRSQVLPQGPGEAQGEGLREVPRHPELRRITCVEIEPGVFQQQC